MSLEKTNMLYHFKRLRKNLKQHIEREEQTNNTYGFSGQMSEDYHSLTLLDNKIKELAKYEQ
jgi:hypothetical protein